MNRWKRPLLIIPVLSMLHGPASAQDTQFGGSYASLSEKQRALVDAWLARFEEVTGQDVEAQPFYDDFVRLSTKTTFDAVTHALERSALTDQSGASLGTALDLIESMETVAGKVKGASGDRQFRMYVRLRPDAVETMHESVEFERGVDNTVFHKGYPINYRQQGGVPSIQISVARDQRRADIDVDYRSSSFPAALFNGHLSASNSDVRAGNNDDRHNGRWAGLSAWWNSFFGVRLQSNYDDTVADSGFEFPDKPRIGKQTIDKMMFDFMSAWLIEGNIAAAMGYISERAYPCLAMRTRDDADLDRGMAPFRLMMRMKAVSEAVGDHDSLEGLLLGVRLTDRSLKLVNQAHHAQFVLYSVPDDIAAEFDCSTQLELNDEGDRKRRREYGNYFGATFFLNLDGAKGETIALLWGQEDGYWKIVSYEAEPQKDDPMAPLHTAPDVELTTIEVDEAFHAAVSDFLTQWFVANDYDAAFDYLAPKSYSCYNLYRDGSVPEARSSEEAARFLRDRLEQIGSIVGARTNIESLLESAEPSHPAVRVMAHADEETFTLTSLPNIIAEWADCAVRARGEAAPSDIPLEYGRAYGANFRVRTASGEPPVFRSLWEKIDGKWKMTSWDIENP